MDKLGDASLSLVSATAILKLERAGFTREQVEALAEYPDGQVSKKVI